MTYTAFFGQIFMAFSPIVTTFFMVLLQDKRLLILSIGGACAWLFSVLLASAWWYIIAPIQDSRWFIIAFAVAFQELCRYLFCRLYFWAERRIERTTGINQFPNRHLVGLAMGVGSGAAYVLVTFLPVVWESKGQATLFCPSCPSTSLFTVSSLIACLFSLLHMGMSVVAFEAYSHKAFLYIPMVVVLHYVASLFTALNDPSGSCVASVLTVLFCVLVQAGFVVLVLKRSPLLLRKRL